MAGVVRSIEDVQDPGTVVSGRDRYIQFLRGVSALAVVAIHVLAACYDNASLLVVRPFLNFCVPMFVFLSGYLTPREKCLDVGKFYSRRISKILVPFLLWSAFYLVVFGELTPKSVLRALVLGGASSQLYYLLVYLQLVLLTPFLYRWLEWPVLRAILWCVTPACLLVRYGLTLAGLASVNIRVFCGTWLSYYLLGLEWRTKVAPLLERHRVGCKRLLIAVLAGLFLQWAEGAAWLAWGNDELAITHMRFSALFTSVATIALAMEAGPEAKRRFGAYRPLVFLGNWSFGLYLCHIAPIKVWKYFLPCAGLWGIPLFVWTMGASIAAIAVCKRFLPRRIVGWLGFS